VQDDAEQRAIDFKAIGIVNEAQFLEFVHEEIHAGARCTYHLRKGFLRDFGKDLLWFIFLTIAGQQEKGASETFFGGVKKLVDQILFNPDIPGEHEVYEAVGEGMFGVEHASHLLLIDRQHGGLRGAGGGAHSKGLTRETTFAKKVSGPEIGQDRFFAIGINDGEPYGALLDVHHLGSDIPLPEDGILFGILDNFFWMPAESRKFCALKAVFWDFPFVRTFSGFGMIRGIYSRILPCVST